MELVRVRKRDHNRGPFRIKHATTKTLLSVVVEEQVLDSGRHPEVLRRYQCAKIYT